MRKLAFGVAAAALMLSEASANDVYYHRAGASWTDYEADVAACTARVAESHANIANQNYGVYGYGGIGAVIGGAIAHGIIAGMEQPRQRQRNMDYCMALRGWTAVNVDDLRDEQNNLVDIDAYTDARVQSWFAQETPPVGRVMLRPEDMMAGTIAGKKGDVEGAADALPPPITLEEALAEQEARRNRNRTRD